MAASLQFGWGLPRRQALARIGSLAGLGGVTGLALVGCGASAEPPTQARPNTALSGKLSSFYSTNVTTPLNTNKGTAKELAASAKPGYDAVAEDTYDASKGKTPS